VGGRYGKYGELKHGEGPENPVPEPLLQAPSSGQRDEEKRDPAVTIRTAEPGDLSFVASLAARVFTVFGQYEQAISDWFRAEGVFTYLAWEDQRPQGFVMISSLYYMSSVLSEIMAIAVSPDTQRKGVGKKLLRKAEESALHGGASFMLLHTAKNNIPARSFFSRNGYYVVSEKPRYYPEGQDALRMIKKLEATRP